MKTYQVYTHKNCQDGQACAWVAWKQFKDKADYHYVGYETPIPDQPLSRANVVYLLDMSRPPEQLIKLAQEVFWVGVLDHHESALVDLIRYLGSTFDRQKLLRYVSKQHFGSTTCTFEEFIDYLEFIQADTTDEVIENFIDQYGIKRVKFSYQKQYSLMIDIDLCRCGAYLSWNHFFDPFPPMLIQYIDTRDRWVWQIPQAEELTEGLFARWYDHLAQPQTLTESIAHSDRDSALYGAQWLNQIIDAPGHIADLIREGKPAVQIRQAEVESILKESLTNVIINGEVYPLADGSKHRSWLGHTILSRGHNYAFSYRYEQNEEFIYMRVNAAPGYRANRLAALFEGGGHPGAAGFTFQRLSTLAVGDKFKVPQIVGDISKGAELIPGTTVYTKTADPQDYGLTDSNPYINRCKAQ